MICLAYELSACRTASVWGHRPRPWLCCLFIWLSTLLWQCSHVINDKSRGCAGNWKGTQGASKVFSDFTDGAMATCASNATDTSLSHDVFETSFGGYNCSFVQEPDQTLFCLICARVLREPQLTDCCGNHYCSSCLKRWLKNSPSCPLCREKNFSSLRDKKTERRVQELEVIFLKLSIGCSYAYFVLASMLSVV